MFDPAGGRSSWAVASGSGGGGFSCTLPRDRTRRAERSDAQKVAWSGVMQDVCELIAEDGETDDEDHREEHHAHQVVDEFVSLHAG